MENGKFWRTLIREFHVSGVEALYGESGFISDRCFGDWVDEETKPIYDLHDAFHYDFSTVTY